MEWISVKDRLPIECDKYYLVLSDKSCNDCLLGNSHSHKLNFIRYQYEVARWSSKDLELVKYYQAKNDHSWNWAEADHWSECNLTDKEITHWISFPNL